MRAIGVFIFEWLEPEILYAGLVYVFFCGVLLWVGARYLAKLPKVKLWKCVVKYALADLLGCLVGLIVWWKIGFLSNHGFLLGGVLVRIAGTWAMLALSLKTSLKKAVLAWLPTILVGCLSVLFLGVLVPSIIRTRILAKRAVCQTNLKGIGTAIILYHANNQDEYPPSFKSLQSDDMMFSCPSSDSDESIDYFYMPPPQLPGHNPIIACDYLDTHPDGIRNILYADGSIGDMTEDFFQQELAKPINAAFAEALKAAEQARAVK